MKQEWMMKLITKLYDGLKRFCKSQMSQRMNF